MSNPYPWIKDSQYLISPVTGYLAVTSPNGLYMVDPTNSSHYTAFGIDTLNLNGTLTNWSTIVAGSATPTLSQVLGQGNSAGASSINMNNNNISSFQQASGQALLLTNTTANATLSVNTGSATSTTLLTKFNNGRTAVNGEAIRLDFNAKNTAGTEFNYARINVDVISSNTNDERSSLNFNVINNAATTGLVTYLNCNGNTQQVNSFKPLNMNTNGISNITDATTINGSFLAPQKVDMLIADGVVPSTNLDLNMRYIACNTGTVSTWVDSGIASFNGQVENVTASYRQFGIYWWVGTESGNIWISDDVGVSWNLFYSFGGRINCLYPFRGNSRLAIGGNFTGSYNYLAVVDTGYNLIDITNGYFGLNDEVKCFFENLSFSCLYIGGKFTDFYGNPGLNTNAFFTYDYSTPQWYSFDNVSQGGFTKNGSVGTVNAICKDNSGLGYYIVGGDFDIINTSSGTIGIAYLFTFETSNGYQMSSYFGIGSPLNAPVNSLVEFQGNGILVGGEFTGVASVPSGSSYDYGLRIIWDYGANSWSVDVYPFTSGSGPITSITQPAVDQNIFDVYTIYNGINIYKDNTLLPAIPVGNAWSCIAWNWTSILYATNAQTSAGFNFYVVNAPSPDINLTSVHPIIQYSTLSYNNIKLLAAGSTIELIWNVAKSQWYILSYQGASFS
jgi:hypothetical protein